MERKIIITVSAILVVTTATILFTSCKNEPVDGQYTDLAKCLTEKGVKFYGAFWCTHCKDQKRYFGDDIRYIDYYECDPRGENSRADECREDGIQAYPSWFFPGQGLEIGVQKLETLAKKANCEATLQSTADSAAAPTGSAETATETPPETTTPIGTGTITPLPVEDTNQAANPTMPVVTSETTGTTQEN